MKLDIKTSILPHVIIIIVFVLITVGFFTPLFKGKTIRQGDIMRHRGASQEIVEHRQKFNEEPLWTNSMFGGMPAYQISVLYKNNFVKYFDKVFTGGISNQAGYFFLYLAGFYILMMALRVNPWLGMVGAIAFAFSSYFTIIIEAGHNSKAHAIGYMAPVFAGIVLAFRGKLLLGGMLTALFLSLELAANHLQITYYLLLLVLIYGVAELIAAIKEKRLPAFAMSAAVLAGAALLAVGTNAGNILTTLEYGKETTRGRSELSIKPDGTPNTDVKTSGLDKDYATGWSYGKAETMTLLIPEFKGGASGYIGNDKKALEDVDPQMKQAVAQMDKYWGDQPGTSGPVYAGALVMFLAVLGLFIVKGPFKWVLFLGTLLSIMLGWGKNFMPLTDFFLDYVPGYNKFRAVSMTLVIAEFTIPLLAVLAVHEIIKNRNILKESITLFGKPVATQRMFIAAFVLTGGIALLFFLSPGSSDVYKTREAEMIAYQITQASPEVDQARAQDYADRLLVEVGVARQQILRSDAGRSFIFILLGGLLVWFYARQRFSHWILIGGIALLVLIDMWGVNARYLGKENYVEKKEMEVPYKITPASEAILNDKSPSYRVLNLTTDTWNDANTSYFHQSIGGYHGAKLKRIQEFIEFYLSRNLNAIVGTLQSSPSDSAISNTLSKLGTLNMLNAKYIIYNPSSPPMLNRFALGNAWFVQDIKTVADRNEEMMETGKIDPAKTAVVEQSFNEQLSGFTPKADPSATITLKSYKANHLVYESNAASEQLAVFSEIWYPHGWKATIDGKDASVIRANYLLRALRVPAGKHTIEFRFEPSSYYTGEKISLASSLLVILLVLGGGFIEIRKLLASK